MLRSQDSSSKCELGENFVQNEVSAGLALVSINEYFQFDTWDVTCSARQQSN